MNDCKDLIEQLRDRATWHQDYGVTLREILASAADAIEALIAERDEEIASHKETNIMLDRVADELAALKQKIASAEPIAISEGNELYWIASNKPPDDYDDDHYLYTLEGIKE